MSESVDSLKQRLVGAFVILSLAVIFLPMLFDKPHREENAAVELVPPKPHVETVVIAKPMPLFSQDVVSDPASPGSNGRGDDHSQPQASSKAGDETQRPAPVAVPASSSKTNGAERELAATAQREPSPSNTPATSAKVYSNVWMVQLGTFSKSENAYTLRDKLRASGVDGHTKPIESGKAIRVFAGPFVTKKEALRIKRKVDAEFKIESLVVFFEA